jgi:hypothetical protein
MTGRQDSRVERGFVTHDGTRISCRFRPAASAEPTGAVRLFHRRGQAWVTRRNPHAEMDRLAERVGFEKRGQRIDAPGIFTVSIARRVPA